MSEPNDRSHSMPLQYVPSREEKYVALGLTIFIFLYCSVFILLPEPIKNPSAVQIVRIMLSVACGVLGGIIPGFLHVDFSKRGIRIRAVGGIALTVITFFFTPSVITNLQTPAEKYMEMYEDGHIKHALGNINGYWDLPNNYEKYYNTPVSGRSKLVKDWIDNKERQNDIVDILLYASNVSICIEDKECNPAQFCKKIFNDIDNIFIFFHPYLSELGSVDHGGYVFEYKKAMNIIDCHCYKERNAKRCNNHSDMCEKPPVCA